MQVGLPPERDGLAVAGEGEEAVTEVADSVPAVQPAGDRDPQFERVVVDPREELPVGTEPESAGRGPDVEPGGRPPRGQLPPFELGILPVSGAGGYESLPVRRDRDSAREGRLTDG